MRLNGDEMYDAFSEYQDAMHDESASPAEEGEREREVPIKAASRSARDDE